MARDTRERSRRHPTGGTHHRDMSVQQSGRIRRRSGSHENLAPADHCNPQSMTLSLPATTGRTLHSSNTLQLSVSARPVCDSLPTVQSNLPYSDYRSPHTRQNHSQLNEFTSLPTLSYTGHPVSLPDISGSVPAIPNTREEGLQGHQGNADIAVHADPHVDHQNNLVTSDYHDSSFYHPVPDAVSGYAVEELPRTLSTVSSHPLESAESRVPNYHQDRSHDCHITDDRVSTAVNTDHLPQPNFYPTARRERRRSQRRSRRRRRRSRHRRRRHHNSNTSHQDERYVSPPCCSILSCKICLAGCLQFKKVLVFFASLGVICVLIGIVMGVLRAPGNSFFTMSLMFVGLGLILLTMVLVGWKCTPETHEPCHMLFGLGSYCRLTRRHRRRRERLHWLRRQLHPEFRYRAPPPSYATAMQEHESDLYTVDSIPYVPGSPPPSYKSHTPAQRPGIHIIFPRNTEFPNSNPPTYRFNGPPERPSLAAMNNVPSIASHESSVNELTRFSVYSTSGLVNSEETSMGVINMSYEESQQDLQEIASSHGVGQSNCYSHTEESSTSHVVDEQYDCEPNTQYIDPSVITLEYCNETGASSI